LAPLRIHQITAAGAVKRRTCSGWPDRVSEAQGHVVAHRRSQRRRDGGNAVGARSVGPTSRHTGLTIHGKDWFSGSVGIVHRVRRDPKETALWVVVVGSFYAFWGVVIWAVYEWGGWKLALLPALVVVLFAFGLTRRVLLARRAGEIKQCPHCAEPVGAAAADCANCGGDLPDVA
jgi:hypothetical protein